MNRTDASRIPGHVDQPIARDLLSLLRLWFAESAPPALVGNWEEVLRFASATKTAGLLAQMADRIDLPSEAKAGLAGIRDTILVRNLRNLDWTTKAVVALDAAGIRPLVFKGALRARQVYGTWNVRASNDVDILVEQARYNDAQGALARAGFAPQVPQDSRWWHDCLGESPYRRPVADCPFIDLHRSLQQPGGPYPADLGDFFATAVATNYGGVELLTPSPFHAILICAINYGKGLRAHEPVIAPLHEIAFATRDFGPGEHGALRDLARDQGLLRLVEDCLLAARTMFLGETDDAADRPPGPAALALATRPWRDHATFDRSRLLWRWTDGGPAARIGRFGTGLGRVLASNLVHHLEERSGKLARPEAAAAQG
ncbi:MAG: nucleotidyltransferase family protein [Erythrobacter sp.]|nr:nucleotidyltransferase family protein [Erythrobacter sp.]